MSTTQPPNPASDDPPRKARQHCNTLDGKQWLQNSISVWDDLRKTPEETRLKHPAMFPMMLVDRLMDCFLSPTGTYVLDPFAGSGSTILAAEARGKIGVGLELSDEYFALANQRLELAHEKNHHKQQANGKDGSRFIQASAEEIGQHIEPKSIDLCITSPPYWNILNQRRSADFKSVRNYGNYAGDLGTLEDYEEFLDRLVGVFEKVLKVLKPGAFCCIVVMDLRKKNRFFPFHADLATKLQNVGFVYDDLLIWNRQSEYNNLRPLGYPSVFRINKVHEFVLLMQKPK